MQPNTYPDGFPQNPIDAIEFSYFLSAEEKADWKQWLTSATDEQKFELVDTLHAMWLENQKSAIPDGFNEPNVQAAPVEQAQPTPAPADQTAPSPAPAPTPKPEEPKPSVSPLNAELEPQEDALSAKQDPFILAPDANNSAKQFGSSPYTSNPLINDDVDEAADITGGNAFDNPQTKRDNKNDKKKRDRNKDRNRDRERDQKKDEQKPQNQPKPAKQDNSSNQSDKKTYFSVTKLRESATKQQLSQLYNEYTNLREESFAKDHEFYKAQGKFLDKVMDVVVNFEQVADLFDSMSEKMIDLNDKLVNQVKDYNEIRSTITTQHGDLLDQVEHLRNDVDRLYRESRETKSDTRRKLEDINGKLATFGADSYGAGGGANQRYDLLTSKLHKMQLQLSRLTGDENQSIQNTDNKGGKPKKSIPINLGNSGE